MVRENVWEEVGSKYADYPKEENQYLFDHATQLKLVRVGQTANEASFPCPVDPHAFSFGTTERGGFVSTSLLIVVSGDYFGWAVTRFRPKGCTTFLCFSVEKEIAQNPARTPKKAIGPTFDATLGFIEDKDGARCDHFAFRLDQSAGNAGDYPPTSGFEDEEGIARGLDPTLPRGLSPSWRRIIGLRGGIRVGHEEGGLDIAKDDIETRRKAAMDGEEGIYQYTLTRRWGKGRKKR